MTRTIINLTSNERWRLNVAYEHSWTINFYGDGERKMHADLLRRGLVAPVDGEPAHCAALTDLGRQALDYLTSKKEQENLLWAAVLNTVETIQASRTAYSGTSRGAAEFIHHDDGTIDSTCLYSSGNEDGTNTEFRITVTLLNDGQTVVKIDESLDHSDDFWGPGGPRDKDYPARRVVVEGAHYYIEPETANPRDFRGFGGRRWEIEFFDGRKVTTTNLWSQGRIPPKWRERFPDNARFVPQESLIFPRALPN